MTLPGLTLTALEIAAYKKNPVLFVKRELGMNPSEDQAKLLMECADLDNKLIIMSAGRGAGKTMVASWIVAWSIAVLPGVFGKYEINILGGSLQQSKQMNGYFKGYLPKSKHLRNKLKGDPTATVTTFEQGKVAALAASDTQTRAPHIDLLVLDEVCSAEDKTIIEALPQVVGSPHGRIIMLSTPHKYRGIFRKNWDRAEEIGFRKYGPWSLEKCSWVQQYLLDFYKIEFTPEQYKVEILGEFPDVGSTVWPMSQIEAAVAAEPFGIHSSYDCDFGLDWGKAHPTVLTPIQYINGKAYIPGPQHIWSMVPYMDLQDNIIDMFRKNRGNAIYADNSHQGENERLDDAGCNVEGIAFSGRKRQMIESISVLLHKRMLVISPDMRELIQQMKDATWELVPRTGTERIRKVDGNDDSVDSLMVGLWRLREEQILDARIPDDFLGVP